jgi:hypothetical protein
MIIHLALVVLLAIAVAVSARSVELSPVNIFIPTLAQNTTGWNTTGGNSTEGLTTSEERGAYSDYGG